MDYETAKQAQAYYESLSPRDPRRGLAWDRWKAAVEAYAKNVEAKRNAKA